MDFFIPDPFGCAWEAEQAAKKCNDDAPLGHLSRGYFLATSS